MREYGHEVMLDKTCQTEGNTHAKALRWEHLGDCTLMVYGGCNIESIPKPTLKVFPGVQER